MKDSQKKRITRNYHPAKESWILEMLSRDSVHLSELQRDPNKYVKYKFKKKTVFLSPEIVK